MSLDYELQRDFIYDPAQFANDDTEFAADFEAQGDESVSDIVEFPITPRVVDSPHKIAFSIRDEQTAGWYLDKLAGFEEKRARIRAQSAKILAEIDASETRLKGRFEWELEDWARSYLSREGRKKKYIDLLQGRINFRSVPASVCVTDPMAAMAYALEHLPEAVEEIPATHKIDKRAYADYVRATGEELPGVEIKPAHESMSITFEKEKK